MTTEEKGLKQEESNLQPAQFKTIQGYSYDQRLENVDIDFNVPHTPIVGLGQ